MSPSRAIINRGTNKQGPEEEEDAGAKRGFFSESVGYTSETLQED